MAIGWFRVKVKNYGTPFDVNFYKNGVLSATKKIVPIPNCTGSLILKYLDADGLFRFQSFEKFYTINDKNKEIGKAERQITSLLTDTTNSVSVGYRTSRAIVANADVDSNQLLILSHISRSPKIYLRVSNYDYYGGTDERWIEVSVSHGGLVKKAKNNGGTFQATIELPEQFNQTLL